jgi:hypothetical protein
MNITSIRLPVSSSRAEPEAVLPIEATNWQKHKGGCDKRIIHDGTSLRNRHCEERSDVAISYSKGSYTIEIATLPPIARDDGGLMSQPHKGFCPMVSCCKEIRHMTCVSYGE